MKQIFKKSLCATWILSLSLLSVYAAEVSPNATIQGSLSCGSVEGSIAVQGSNASITSAGNWCDRNGKIAFTAKAGSSGIAVISLVGVDATDVSDPNNLKPVNGQVISSLSYTIKQPSTNNGNTQTPETGSNQGTTGGSTNTTQKPVTTTPEKENTSLSSNANLSSLTISKGSLDPKFDAEVTSYSVTLDASLTSVNIDAKAQDAKATIQGAGTIELAKEDKSVSITVTAEDGSKKTYKIQIKMEQEPEITIAYNGQQLGVVQNIDDVQAPDTFEKTTVQLEGKEIPAWKSNQLNSVIVYLQNAQKEKNFYLYDEETKQILSIYKPIALLGRNLVIIDIPKELQDRYEMIYQEVEVDQQKMMGWVFKDSTFANYALIYVLDDTGTAQYYLYEKNENTLQLYTNQAAITQEQFDKLLVKHDQELQQRLWVVLGLLGTNILTILLLLIALRKKKRPKKIVLDHPQEQTEGIKNTNYTTEYDFTQENHDQDIV